MPGFLLTTEELRARRNLKWTAHPADVLPAWLAEMDFTVASAIHAAVTRLAAQQDYGYRFFNETPVLGAASQPKRACIRRAKAAPQHRCLVKEAIAVILLRGETG